MWLAILRRRGLSRRRNRICPPVWTVTAPALNASADSKKVPPTDLRELARRIVTQSAGVKEGEVVIIFGGVRDLELLEHLNIEVKKADGYPLQILDTERIALRSITEVPEKYDSQGPKAMMEMANTN